MSHKQMRCLIAFSFVPECQREIYFCNTKQKMQEEYLSRTYAVTTEKLFTSNVPLLLRQTANDSPQQPIKGYALSLAFALTNLSIHFTLPVW